MSSKFDYVAPLKRLLEEIEKLVLRDEYPVGTGFAVCLFAPNGEVVFGSNLQGEHLARFLEKWAGDLRAGTLPPNYKKGSAS